MKVSHQAVLLEEAIRALNIQPDGIYVDGTFGRGGHSRVILEHLGFAGQLLAMDRDPSAVSYGAAWQDKRFELLHARFSMLGEILAKQGITSVQGILLDLGVSSPQLDERERGFSFKENGPLDMRMDPGTGMSAAQWLSQASADEIERVLRDYGEERYARIIARAIVTQRESQQIDSTEKLSLLVARVVPHRERHKDPATRTFQALRILVNDEINELQAVLPVLVQTLAPRGRLVVISFHSLEDRLVKQFIRTQSQPPEIPRGLPVRESERVIPPLKKIGRSIRPTAQEVAHNPRARSAVMRVAERAEEARA